MPQIYTVIKQKALSWLPEPALRYLKKIHYARMLDSFSIEDQPDLKVVQFLVQPGESVLDIGANVGVYTKNLSKLVGAEGKVYSIEPVPSTYEILCSNIRRLKLSNVEPLNCAMSNWHGTATMFIPRYSTGGEDFYQAQMVTSKIKPKQNDRCVHVEAVTLDSKFVILAQKISFVKCDVEGHGLACIEGAEDFLMNSTAAWLLEVPGDPINPESQAHAIFKKFIKLNYSVWWFDGVRLRQLQEGESRLNYFFLLPNHLEHLRNKNPLLFA